MITNQSNSNTGAVPKEKSSKSAKQQQPRKPPPTVDTFWPSIMQEVQNTPVVDAKHQALPLARIKKIMKLDENAKMIAAEAPLLFAKACEFFIQELTMRAWTHTDESKRRTLQRSDIAQAIANYDQFDFLIDIVPREDIKPSSNRKNHSHDTNASNNATANSCTSSGSATNASTQDVIHVSADTVAALPQVTNQQAPGSVNVATPNNTQATQVLTTSNPTQQLQIIQQTSQPQQLQYFITLPGQQQGQAQLQLHQLQLQQQQQLPNTITTPLTTTNLNLVAQQPQQLILTATNPNNQGSNLTQQQQQAAMIQNLVQQQQPQIQLFQQVVVSPTGEISNLPITISANQLNLFRLQMQQQQQQQQQQTQQTHQVTTHQPTQQQVIIPSNCQLLTAQQILQNHANANSNSGSTATIVHHQPTTQQHHTSSQPATNTIYINAGNATATPATVQTSLVSADRNLGNAYRNNC